MRIFGTLAKICLLIFVSWTCVQAQGVVTPQFSLIGPLETFTLNPGTALNRGAIMHVSGVDVVLPANLQIQFPTKFLTPAQAFRDNPSGVTTESGLALNDVNPPRGSYEVIITGNIVNGRYIAGLVSIAQLSLGTGAGYIKAINFADGTLTIGADPTVTPNPATDVRVHLNDPDGRFGNPTKTLNFDERFAVDDGNPSVLSATGFPMCVPRTAVDPACPLGNRGGGAVPMRLFVMDANSITPSPADSPLILGCPSCDKNKFAPLMTGDFVLFSGVLKADPANPRNSIITAYALQANVGIYTKPGTSPAYVAIEGSLVGAWGPRTDRCGRVPPPLALDPTCAVPGLGAATNHVIPIEGQDRFKIEGWTTDPTATIEIYAVDVSATGVKKLRFLFLQRASAVPFGRFRLIRGDHAGILVDATGLKGATKELMVRIRSGSGANLNGSPVPEPGDVDYTKVARGVIPGQYVAPVSEFIFPENKVMGDVLVPNNFQCLAFLVNGQGPPDDEPAGTPNLGQLSPWPGAVGTNVLDCGPPPKPPIP